MLRFLLRPLLPSVSVCRPQFAFLVTEFAYFPAPQREEMAAQFSQLSMSRQSSGDTPEPPSGPVYPASLMQAAQPPSYVITSAGQQLSTGGFSDSGPPISQQVLQAPPSPQGFVQQPPPAQVGAVFPSLHHRHHRWLVAV